MRTRVRVDRRLAASAPSNQQLGLRNGGRRRRCVASFPDRSRRRPKVRRGECERCDPRGHSSSSKNRCGSRAPSTFCRFLLRDWRRAHRAAMKQWPDGRRKGWCGRGVRSAPPKPRRRHSVAFVRPQGRCLAARDTNRPAAKDAARSVRGNVEARDAARRRAKARRSTRRARGSV
jgi:hypothetical protein